MTDQAYRASETGPWPAPEPELEKRALGLRDFFRARNRAELQAAGQAWAESDQDCQDWTELEYHFNRLFVGPGPVWAPLYASFYLEPEPQLMGRTTLGIKALMDNLGLSPNPDGREPEDHVGLELELWCVLKYLLAASGGEDPVSAGNLARVLNWFENEHLGVWLPLFVERAGRADRVPALIQAVLSDLGQWLITIRERGTDATR